VIIFLRESSIMNKLSYVKLTGIDWRDPLVSAPCILVFLWVYVLSPSCLFKFIDVYYCIPSLAAKVVL